MASAGLIDLTEDSPAKPSLVTLSPARPVLSRQAASHSSPTQTSGTRSPLSPDAQRPASPQPPWFGGPPLSPLSGQKRPREESLMSSDADRVSDTFKSRGASNSMPAVQDGAVASTQADASSPVLSPQQVEVLELVKQGRNVFFTGNAGTGKSFLLNRIIADLKELYGEDYQASVAVTAATGIAATHIHGTTVHSAVGCGVPQTTQDFGRMWKADKRAKIRALKVLIVDEVSMISAEMFEALETACRTLRQRNDPYGGIQLILSGDYFQLPPIEKRWVPAMGPDAFLNRGFTFQAPAWKRCNLQQILLTKVFRQSDQQFVSILDRLRQGGPQGQQAVQELSSVCQRPLQSASGVKPTQLFSRNADVDRVNTEELRALQGEAVDMPGKDDVAIGGIEEGDSSGNMDYRRQQLWRHEFFRDCMAPKEGSFKVGAQVMLLKNLELDCGERMLVNGSRGVITKFVGKPELLSDLMKGRVQLSQQWTQGARDSKIGEEVGKAEQARSMLEQWPGTKVPYVRFLNGREEAVLPEKFSVDVPGLGSCMRIQIPLKLAWALTIHKCQGLTLDLAKVSLKNMFAEGQCYVALSRVRSMEGLQILDSNSDCVKASAVVRRFYQCLVHGEEYSDGAWELWQEKHPSEVTAATMAASSGAVGMGSQGDSAGGSQSAGGRRAPSSFASQPQTAAGTASKGGGDCFKCGGNDHWARDCPGSSSSTPGNSQGPSQRGRGLHGYFAGVSNGRGVGRGRAAPQGQRGGGRAGGAGRGACFKCGRGDHWASNCPG
ncbi:hypothetical protein WJX74_003930 [Apatococcus lobatus]|uniref:ATP-dependent DNA helicase n=1 Tax=Apatococcus lobatus TaxID=904363 RepID=A0AAW1QYG2_9CHLO